MFKEDIRLENVNSSVDILRNIKNPKDAKTL